MIRKFFPSKDTTITNTQLRGTQMTGSNLGGSEILDVYVIGAVSGSTGVSATGSLARALLQFDTDYIGQLTASGDVRSSATWELVLHNAQHNTTLPSSYTIEIVPLSASWDEGNGVDNVTFSDAGYANWVKRTSQLSWQTSGADVIQDSATTFDIDLGGEDVIVDVGSIVGSWLSASYANNGLLVRVTSSLEAGYIDYYKKSFHGRKTKFASKKPHLRAVWDDSINDDRKKFYFDTTGSLYLYYSVDGTLTNIPGLSLGNNVIDVRIENSGTVITNLSGSHTGRTGIYSASFAIPNSTYSGSTFTDVWHTTGTPFMTGTFSVTTASFYTQALQAQRYEVSMRGVSNTYTTQDDVRFETHIRRTSSPQHVYLTASVDTTGIIEKNMYYRIDDDVTGDTVIPFATGSIKYTKLSYDSSGNYFNFSMSSLPPGSVYRILLMIDRDGQKVVYDKGWKFKVI